nr:MAG TPA: hypothetical protein [Caudoviricetes sp.]DAT68306.1 MAG TPA: hypothetical protein [Caudoviricetes sp.]
MKNRVPESIRVDSENPNHERAKGNHVSADC